PPESFPPGEREAHPFGLIEQALGLLCARAWRETGQAGFASRAAEAFTCASTSMDRGGPLLRVLARFPAVRRDLFALAVSPAARATCAALERRFLALRGLLAGSFGAPAWQEDESGRASGYFGGLDPGVGTALAERARRVVAGIRFNYW